MAINLPPNIVSVCIKPAEKHELERMVSFVKALHYTSSLKVAIRKAIQKTAN